ncbi:hypothetical protein Tco_1396211 [Tanacetum coccineum]
MHAQSPAASTVVAQTPQMQFSLANVPFYGAPAMYPAPVSYATILPQAFHTMTPRDPSWNMDTEASSHLADNAGKHAKLPFYNSESSVDSVFEIIHSDIWMIYTDNAKITRKRSKLNKHGHRNG